MSTTSTTLTKLNRVREIALKIYCAAPYWGAEDIIKFNKSMNFIERLMRGWRKVVDVKDQHNRIIYYTRHNSPYALKVSFPTLRDKRGFIIEVIRKEECPKKLA